MSSRSSRRSRQEGNKSQPSSASVSDDDTVEEVEINSDSDGSDDGDSSDSAPKSKTKKRGEPTFNKSAFSMPDDVKKLIERVLCCSCGKQLNPMINGSIRRHPWLKVVTCKKCYKFLRSGPFTMDKDGIDEQCRWCGDGGRLYGCDYCNHCFCRHCIKRNLGRSEAAKMEDDIGKWHCYMCKPKQIAKLQQDCTKILEYIDKEDQKEKDKQERAKQREKEKEEVARKEREEKAKAKAERREKEIKKEREDRRNDEGKVKIDVKGEKADDKTKETSKKGFPAPKSRDTLAEELKTKTPKVEKSDADVIVLNSPEKIRDSVPHYQHHRATLYKPDADTGVTNVVKGGNVLQVTVGPKKPLPVSMPYKDKDLTIKPRTVPSTMPLIGNPPVAAGNTIRNMLTTNPVSLNRGLQNQTQPERNDINQLKSVIYPFNVESFIEKLNTVSSSFNLSISSIKTDLAIAKLTNANNYNAKNAACTHLRTALDVFFNNLRSTFNVKLSATLPGNKPAAATGMSTSFSSVGAAAGEPMPDVIALVNPPVNKAMGKSDDKAIVIDDNSIDGDSCSVTDDDAGDKREKKVNGEDFVLEINEDFNENEGKKDNKESGKDKSNSNADSKEENGEQSMEVDDNDDDNGDESEEQTNKLDISENTAAKLELLKELEDELSDDDDASEDEEPKETKRTTRSKGNDKKEAKDDKSETSSTRSSRSKSPQKKSYKTKSDIKETETESESEKQDDKTRRKSGRISELKDHKSDSIDSVDDKDQDDNDDDDDGEVSSSSKRTSRSKTRGQKSENMSDQESDKKGDKKKVDKESIKLLRKSASSRSLRSEQENKDSEDDFQAEKKSSPRSKSSDKKSSKGKANGKDAETESESEKQDDKSRRRSNRIPELKDSKTDTVDDSVEEDSQSEKKSARSKGNKEKDSKSKPSEKSKSSENNDNAEASNNIDDTNTEDDDGDDSSKVRSSRRKSSEKKEEKSTDKSKGKEKKVSENARDAEKKQEKGKKSSPQKPSITENGDLSSESGSDDSDSDIEEPEFGKRKKSRKSAQKERGESQESDLTTKQTRSKKSKSDKEKKSGDKELTKSGKDVKSESRKSERNKAKKEDKVVSDSDSEFDPELEKEIESLSKDTKLTKKKASSSESQSGKGKGKKGEKAENRRKDESKGKTGKERQKEESEMNIDSDQSDDDNDDNGDDNDDENTEVDDVASESSARDTRSSRLKGKVGKDSGTKSKSGGSQKKSAGHGVGIYTSDSDDDDDEGPPPDDSDDSDTSEELSASQIKKLKQAERKAKESDDDSEFGEDVELISEESSDPEISFKNSPKKGQKNKKKADTASDDSDFVTPKKKKKKAFRNDLLDTRISDSEDDKKTKAKGKGKGKRKKPEDSEDLDASTDDGKKKKGGKGGKKRRRIKKIDSSDEDKEPGAEDELESGSEGDPDTPGGYLKRRKIRKVHGLKKLDKSTKAAQKAEEERRKRIEERQKEYNAYVEVEGGEEEEELPEGTEREIVSEEKTDSISQILGSPKKIPVTTKCILEMDKEKKKPLIEVNRTLIRKLKPHQVEAIRFMYNCLVESIERMKKEEGAGCILAHCMGLGKTLSVISFVHTMLSNVKHTKMKRCLVVCPLNTCLNWVNEFEIWLDDVDFEIDVYEMSKVKQNFERAEMLKEWMEGGAGVLIMGYEMYRNLVQGSHCRNKKQKKIFYEALADPGPDIVICDEGHILKNDETSLSKSMNKIVSKRRVVLTGTPLQNNLKEYHCMVNFVKPQLIGTRKEFNNRFANPITNGQCSDSTPMDVKLMKRRAHILHELLAGCVQRKDYSALTKFLPPKHEYVISVRLSTLQMTLYEKYLELSGLSSGDVASKGARLFKDYQALMRIWTHPWVMKLDEIRQENKRALEDTDEDSFIDDYDSEDSFIDNSTSMSDSSDSEASSKGKGKGKGKKGKGKARKKRGAPSESSDDDDSSKKKADGDEVVKKWTSKTRGNEEGAGSSWMQDLGYQTGPKELSSEWWAEFVKEEDENKLELSGKLMLLFEILKMCEDIGDKVLVFSQSLLSLDIIEDFLEKIDTAHQTEMNEGTSPGTAGASGSSAGATTGDAGGSGGTGGSGSGSGEKSEEEKKKEDLRERFSKYGKSWTKGADYFRMDGSTSSVHRKSAQDMFNNPDNYRARLFLISTKAGSLGINLVSANRVIIFDASWNPSHDIQSIFRVYRFGQVKPVYVYRFLAQGTMEEKIYERQVTKQSLSQRVVDEHQIERHFTTSDLQELYKFTPDRLDDPNRKEKIPVLPKDHMLAELMTTNKEWITTFHEHDSLLENIVEQELNEEEKKAAWEDYENEKKGLITNAPFGGMGSAHLNPAIMATQQMNMQNLLMQGQSTLGQAAVLQIVQDLKSRFPNTPPEIFQQRVQAVLRQVLTQQIMQQSEMQRRQIEQQRMNELNRLNQIKQQIQRQQAMLSNQQRTFGLNPPGASSLPQTGSFVNLANPASGYITSTSGMVHPQSMPNLRMAMMGKTQDTSSSQKK